MATTSKARKSPATRDREESQHRTQLAQIRELKAQVAGLQAASTLQLETIAALTKERDTWRESALKKEKLLGVYQRKLRDTRGKQRPLPLGDSIGSTYERLKATAEKLGVPVSKLTYRSGTIYHGKDAVA